MDTGASQPLPTHSPVWTDLTARASGDAFKILKAGKNPCLSISLHVQRHVPSPQSIPSLPLAATFPAGPGWGKLQSTPAHSSWAGQRLCSSGNSDRGSGNVLEGSHSLGLLLGNWAGWGNWLLPISAVAAATEVEFSPHAVWLEQAELALKLFLPMGLLGEEEEEEGGREHEFEHGGEVVGGGNSYMLWEQFLFFKKIPSYGASTTVQSKRVV